MFRGRRAGSLLRAEGAGGAVGKVLERVGVLKPENVKCKGLNRRIRKHLHLIRNLCKNLHQRSLRWLIMSKHLHRRLRWQPGQVQSRELRVFGNARRWSSRPVLVTVLLGVANLKSLMSIMFMRWGRFKCNS